MFKALCNSQVNDTLSFIAARVAAFGSLLLYLCLIFIHLCNSSPTHTHFHPILAHDSKEQKSYPATQLWRKQSESVGKYSKSENFSS